MTGIISALAGMASTSSASPVSITDQYVSDSAFGTATAFYSITSTGLAQSQYGTLESWLPSGASASNYEVRAVVASGSPLTSGSVDSWLNCGTTRTWALSNSSQDNSMLTTVLTVSIRLASSGAVQDTATITLSAESEYAGRGGLA